MPPPPPNLAISSQMTTKLGRDVLWVKIFTNQQKVLITSLSFPFYNVVIILIWRNSYKSGRFMGAFAEYLKTLQLTFAKLVSFFGQLSVVPFEIKTLRTGYSLLPW